MAATRGKVVKLRRSAGIAGLFAVTVTATYEDDPEIAITFIGSVYGGPVVIELPSGGADIRYRTRTIGKFGEEWVRRLVEGIEQ